MPNANALDPQQEASVIARCMQMEVGEQTTIRALNILLTAEGHTGITLTRLVQLLDGHPHFEVLENGQVTRI